MNENGNITQYTLLHSEGELWQSAAVAALKACLAIKNESVDTPRHTERLQWMYNVMANPDAWVTANRWYLLQSATIVAGGHKTNDNDVEHVVNLLVPV